MIDKTTSLPAAIAEIANDLYISEATAATHVRNILRKSGLSNRRDLMLVAGR